MFFIALAQTDEASGLWPVAAARAVSIPIAITVALVLGVAHRPKLRDTRLLATAGSLDMAANVFYLLAARSGMLITASVITALYPAPTVLLQRAVFKEALGWRKIAGLVLAVTGIALIGLG